MPLPGVNISTSNLGINANFSQLNDLGSKIGLDKLKDVVSGGISKVSDAAKGLFGGRPPLKTSTSFPASPDFRGAPNAASAPSAAAAHRMSERNYANSPEANKGYNGPAGALIYPAGMKYYTLFTFNQYERITATSEPKEKTSISIVLPMPADLKEDHSIDYEEPALGTIVGSISDSVIQGIRSAQGADSSQSLMSNEDKKATTMVAQAIGAGMIKGLAALPKGGESLSAVARASTGLAPNPYLAVIFKNVELRTHTFQYRFAPRSQEELNTLKKIIKELKIRMLPGLTKGSDVLFTFPDTCDISFGPNKEVPYKIKKCVMKSISVNYAPNGPAFFKTGDPVIVDIQMTFREMIPFTREDLGAGSKNVTLPQTVPPPAGNVTVDGTNIGANQPSTPG